MTIGTVAQNPHSRRKSCDQKPWLDQETAIRFLPQSFPWIPFKVTFDIPGSEMTGRLPPKSSYITKNHS